MTDMMLIVMLQKIRLCKRVVQIAASAQAFFLIHGAAKNASARLTGIGKVQNRCPQSRLCGFPCTLKGRICKDINLKVSLDPAKL